MSMPHSRQTSLRLRHSKRKSDGQGRSKFHFCRYHHRCYTLCTPWMQEHLEALVCSLFLVSRSPRLTPEIEGFLTRVSKEQCTANPACSCILELRNSIVHNLTALRISRGDQFCVGALRFHRLDLFCPAKRCK